MRVRTRARMVKFRVEAELPMEVDAYFADAWGDGPETEGFRAIMASVLNFRGMDVLERQLKEDGSKVVRLLTKPNLSLPAAVNAMLARAGGNFELVDTLEFPAQQPAALGIHKHYHLNFSSMTPLIKGLYEVQGKITVEPLTSNTCRQVLEGTATVNMFGFKYVIEGIIAQQVKSTYEKLPAVVKRWKAQKLWKRAMALIVSGRKVTATNAGQRLPIFLTPSKHERTITPDSVLDGINESDIESEEDGSGLLTFREFHTPPSSPMSTCSALSFDDQCSYGYHTPRADSFSMREKFRDVEMGRLMQQTAAAEDAFSPRDVIVRIAMDEEVPSASALDASSNASLPQAIATYVGDVLRQVGGGFQTCLPSSSGSWGSTADDEFYPLMRVDAQANAQANAGRQSNRGLVGLVSGMDGGFPLHRRLLFGTSAVAMVFLMMQGFVSIA